MMSTEGNPEEALEADLLSVARERDRAAFARLFDFYAPRVKAYLRRLGAEDAIAEDLMQEVMLSIWRRADQFDRSRAALSTWVYTIARNKRIDALRRDRRPDLDPDDPALVAESEDASRGDLYAEAAQARRDILRAVEQLPPEQAQLLRIFYFEEKPHSVIARAGLAARYGEVAAPAGLEQAAHLDERRPCMNERQHLDELLMAHAAGRLPEPLALIVATHLALSPQARARYGRFLALGGIFLEALEPAPLASDAWERLLDRLDEAEAASSRAARGPTEDEEELASLPQPLRTYLRVPPEGRCWRPLGGACELELRLRTPGFRTSLLRVGAGKAVPRHTQEGNELTLVLAGGFHDRTGHYRRGDLAMADSTIDRRPTADPDGDCLCLVVTDAPWRLTGPFGWLLNPFFRC